MSELTELLKDSDTLKYTYPEIEVEYENGWLTIYKNEYPIATYYQTLDDNFELSSCVYELEHVLFDSLDYIQELESTLLWCNNH